MPQPTASDVHVNVPLTQISIAYMQEASAFVADRVFPVVSVPKQSDRYYVYDREFWFRDEMKKRAPGAESEGSGWEVDNTPTYYADVWALHKDVDDQIRANADPQANPDVAATEWLTLKGLIKRDVTWAANYFVTSVWTNELTGVSGAPGAGEFQQWNEAASTPIEDIETGRITMEELTGFRPNKLTLSPHAVKALKNHADILDRIKYTQRGQVTLDLLAALFEVDEVIEARGVQNTAVEGATESNSYILGKNALLSYSPPSPSMLTPSAGYTFAWNGLLGAGAQGNRISRFRMEHLKSDRVEIEMAMDLKLVAADLGYFFLTCVA